MKYMVIDYTFGSGATIEAALRHVSGEHLSKSDLKKLIVDFTAINGDIVPRIGTIVQLPLPSNSTSYHRGYVPRKIEIHSKS